MTAITDTPFAKLEAEGRLLKPALKADTHVEGGAGSASAATSPTMARKPS